MRDPGSSTRSTPWSDTPAPYEISREQDAHYSARSFVRWVRLETTARRGGERRIDMTRGEAA